MRRIFCLLLAAFLLAAIPAGCQRVESEGPVEQPGEENGAAEGSGQPAQDEPQPQPEPEPEPEPEPIHIRIAAVGDNLLHNTVSNGQKQADGTFDYAPLYANVSALMAGADIAFINQEVPLAGEVGAYPLLSAPTDLAPGLKQSGFNIINHATTHALDKGQKGLLTSLEALKAQGFDAVLGCYASEEEANTPIIVEKQGITFGFLSYTYGTNGIPLPEDKPWLISLIDEDKIESDMAALRPECDVLIVSLHWGNEYQLTPSDSQQALGQKVADWGADIIIGHHPHVLQPMAMLDRADGGQTLCIYSLGNFVSGQHKMDTMLGGMLWCELTFTAGQDGFAFEKAGVVPLVTHYEGTGKNFAIIPLSDYTPELAEKHGIANYEGRASVEYFEDLAARVLGGYVLAPEDLS